MMNNMLKLILRSCICGVILAGSIWTFNFGLGDGPNPGGYASAIRSCLIVFAPPSAVPTTAILEEQLMFGATLFAGVVLILQLLLRREAALSVGEKLEVGWRESLRNSVRRPRKRVGAKTSAPPRRKRALFLQA